MDWFDQITGNVPFVGAFDSTGITGITESIVQGVVVSSLIVQQTYTQTTQEIAQISQTVVDSVNLGEQVYQDTSTQITQTVVDSVNLGEQIYQGTSTQISQTVADSVNLGEQVYQGIFSAISNAFDGFF